MSIDHRASLYNVNLEFQEITVKYLSKEQKNSFLK